MRVLPSKGRARNKMGWLSCAAYSLHEIREQRIKRIQGAELFETFPFIALRMLKTVCNTFHIFVLPNHTTRRQSLILGR